MWPYAPSYWLMDGAICAKLLANGASMHAQVWMGGLMDPTAYFTATRQACAQAKGWALERLELLVLFQVPTI